MKTNVSEPFTKEMPDWLKDADLYPDTLSHHIDNPKESPDSYIRRKHIEHGTTVLRLKRIYLDQNYWNYCRDVARGCPKHPAHIDIYEALKQGVKEGILICPASHLVLQETFKQSDPESRQATALVIQELSNGVAIQPFPVLTQAEVIQYVRAASHLDSEMYPIEYFAWTNVGNVFGLQVPVLKDIDAATLSAIQKSWFDLMAKVKFTTLVSALGDSPREMGFTAPQSYYDIQNSLCEIHRNAFSTFEEVFMIELKGVLEAHLPIFRDCMLYLYESEIGKYPYPVPKKEADEGANGLAGLIYSAFKEKKISKQLPGIRIMAGIHAAIRHKRQKHWPGDQEDHLHARAAIPYCNLMLTEKTLGHLLTTKPLSYNELYGCRVEWNPDRIKQAILQTIK